MIKPERLPNGLVVTFQDRSNRYFGDYHHICVVATIHCEIKLLHDEGLKKQAENLYGQTLEVEKRFERMGVPSAEVDRVRADLVNDFLTNAAAYLSRPDYPGKLVRSEMSKRRSSRFYV